MLLLYACNQQPLNRKRQTIAKQSSIQTESETWRRHRKVLGSQFNEGMLGQVWIEALSLSTTMLARWTSTSKSLPTANRETPSRTYIVEDMSPDMTTLGLSVITTAGFGLPISFQNHRGNMISQDEIGDVDSRRNWSGLDANRVALFPKYFEYLVSNVIKLVVIPSPILRLGPSSWRALATAFHEVKSMFRDMMDIEVKRQKMPSTSAEQQHVKRGVLGEIVNSGGLLEGNVENTSQNKEVDPAIVAALSKEEVQGNIFMLALAGSRTTSDTLLFSCILLALHPDIQDWVVQDIDKAVADEDKDPLKWRYQTLFPKLIAPLCVMVGLFFFRIIPLNLAF